MEVAIVFFSSIVTSIRVKRHLKWEGRTWFRPSRIDWIIGSWGVANKMEADLNASLQLVVGGFLSIGFTADTLTQWWANLALPGHFPSDIWSNPDKTHLPVAF